MPSYDYTCLKCKKDFSVYLTLKEADSKSKVTCTHCKSDSVEKKFTAFFAKTDRKS